MKNVFQISIPKLCHENWDAFTPTPTGGFCGSCQKNVRDFTKMSETELIAYFRNMATAKNNTLCGRFREDQLQKDFETQQWFPEWIIEENQVFYEVSLEKLKEKPLKIAIPSIYRNRFFRNSIAAIPIATMMVLSLGVNAQNKIVSGKITDAIDGSALPGVSIQVVGTNRGTQSNIDGEYSIEIDEKQFLRFSFVGYETEELLPKNNLKVSLEMDNTVLGEVVVVGKASPRLCGVAGGISIKQTSYFEKEKIQPIPQPTKLTLYPNIAQNDEVFLKPEVIETEDGIEKTAFGEIESLLVYEYYTGKNYQITYEKEENGDLSLNISKIPNGLYVVRLSQKNHTATEKPIISIARLVVER